MRFSVRQWLCRLIALVLIAQAPLAVATTCASSMQQQAETAAMDCHGADMMVMAKSLPEHSEDGSCCDRCNDCATLQSTMVVSNLFADIDSFRAIYGMSNHHKVVPTRLENPFRPPIS